MKNMFNYCISTNFIFQIQQNLLKLNNCQLLFLRILNYSYFDLDFDLVCLQKSRAVCTNFLDFMDSPSQTYMKWPLDKKKYGKNTATKIGKKSVKSVHIKWQ